jgi:threonine aldolase
VPEGVTIMTNPARIDVDLYSDTVSKPSADMRRFMCEAEVGDEQKFEDPTVNQLCEMVADLLGKESAVFMPSGTMCNEIALRVHARHGEEVIAHRSAHPINSEAGGPAALAGVNVRAIDGPRGQFDVAAVEAAIRPRTRHAPRTRLLWVEQTSNHGGGSIWPMARIEAVTAVARRHGLATHMDGARLMNAVVASGISARDYSEPFDSVWIDFTKGLGAPVGAALAGSRDFIDEAWRWKQRLGGAMRQAGVCAAACMYALDHHVDRLADDHAHARALARGLSQIAGIEVQQPETNLVFFTPDAAGVSADAMVAELGRRGVLLATMDGRIRACTHLDVSAAMVEETVELVREIARGA